MSVSLVYPCDGMTDWELHLIATVWHHRRGSYCVSLLWGNINIHNSKYGFYWVNSIAL